MPISESMIVIASHDLAHQETRVNLAEQDCACPEGHLSLVSDYRTGSELCRVEQDCTTDDSLALLSGIPNARETSAYALPSLHRDRLAQGFHLAFNPMGQAGVVVFNDPVLTLLNAFQQPRPLAEGVRRAGEPPDGLATLHRLLGLGLLEPYGSQRRHKRTKPRTLTAWLHVTNDCNLRCPYCYVYKTPDAMEIERGRQAVDAVFRSARTNGFRRVKLKYAGGEATLNFPLVITLHDYARCLAEEHDLELDGVLLSNGVALSNRMIEALQVSGLRLMISLDGVGEYHDAQRQFVNGYGSFDHVERTLNRLAGYDFVPSISITVSNRNLEGLPETVDYVLRRELPFTINFYRENDCSASFSDLAYRDEQIIAAMKAAFAVIESKLPPFSLLDVLVDRARLGTLHDRPCGVGQSYLVIDQNGGVAKCHMELEQSVTDVSVADPLRMIREDQVGVQNLPVEEKEGCRECTWRYWCAGDCPALTYRMTGRFDVKSPNCRVYKALFPKVLRLEGLRLLEYSGAMSIT